MTAALVVPALASTGAGCLVAIRGVGDAALRARRIAASHHAPVGTPVPARLARAVVASEDDRFGDEVLVNVAFGVGRAGLASARGESNPGGATIDQQLAKALYGPGAGAAGVLRQIGLGIKLGLSYPQRELLEMYLEVNYFGHGFWGVDEAARGYFAIPPRDLSWAQASLLAGLLQAPSADDPLLHPLAARLRERYVLGRLAADGVLSARRARAALAAPLSLR